MAKKGGARKWNLIQIIMGLLISLLVTGAGGYIASGSWMVPFFEELGSKVTGWAVLVVGFLALVSHITALVMYLMKKV